MNKLLVVALALSPVATHAQYPDAFTWKRYVPRVQDQLRQGPCYAHAATGLVEAMYNLSFHGPGSRTGTQLNAITGIDLSERQVYSCAHPSGVASLTAALAYVSSSGAVTAACIPYPSASCSEASDQWPRVVLGSYDCPAEQVRCGERVRAVSQDVSSEASLGAAAIQALLVHRGPIAVNFQDGPLHFGGPHGYLLHGWRTVGGKLRWLLRDSWPCAAKDAVELEESSDPSSGFHLAQLFTQSANNKAFVVTAVLPERYVGGTWVPRAPGVMPFELEPENQIVKIVPSGGCYNQGTYRVSGLELLPGATVIGWSVRTASQRITPTVSIAWSGAQTGDAPAVLTGNGEEMTVVATVQRANGLRENVTRYVGTVGIPYLVNQSSGCAGSRREVALSLVALAPPASTTARMVFATSPDNSYYVMGNGSSYAYVVFNRTTSADFRVQVTSSSPGCSLALDEYRYVMGYPCFTYPSYPY